MPMTAPQRVSLTRFLVSMRPDWPELRVAQACKILAEQPGTVAVLSARAVTLAGDASKRDPEIISRIPSQPGGSPGTSGAIRRGPCKEHGGYIRNHMGEYVCCLQEAGTSMPTNQGATRDG